MTFHNLTDALNWAFLKPELREVQVGDRGHRLRFSVNYELQLHPDWGDWQGIRGSWETMLKATVFSCVEVPPSSIYIASSGFGCQSHMVSRLIVALKEELAPKPESSFLSLLQQRESLTPLESLRSMPTSSLSIRERYMRLENARAHASRGGMEMIVDEAAEFPLKALARWKSERASAKYVGKMQGNEPQPSYARADDLILRLEIEEDDDDDGDDFLG